MLATGILILFLFFVFAYLFYLMGKFLEWQEYDYIQKVFPNLFWRFHEDIKPYFNKIKKVEAEEGKCILSLSDSWRGWYEVHGWYEIYGILSGKFSEKESNENNSEAIKAIGVFMSKTDSFLAEMKEQSCLNEVEANFLAYYIWNSYKDWDWNAPITIESFEESLENLKNLFKNLKK